MIFFNSDKADKMLMGMMIAIPVVSVGLMIHRFISGLLALMGF